MQYSYVNCREKVPLASRIHMSARSRWTNMRQMVLLFANDRHILWTRPSASSAANKIQFELNINRSYQLIYAVFNPFVPLHTRVDRTLTAFNFCEWERMRSQQSRIGSHHAVPLTDWRVCIFQYFPNAIAIDQRSTQVLLCAPCCSGRGRNRWEGEPSKVRSETKPHTATADQIPWHALWMSLIQRRHRLAHTHRTRLRSTPATREFAIRLFE